MKFHRGLWSVALAGLCAAGLGVDAGGRPDARLVLVAGQNDFLAQEPILVTARLEGVSGATLPAGPGKAGDTWLRFEIVPPVKLRSGAKPLPLEEKGANLPATARTYDLLEWFQFPAQGSWTVRAVVERKGAVLAAAPLKVTITRPAKDDREHGPVDRLHHIPWSNYTTNAFCGDCFDLVKNWPRSRLARYAHYWNGVHHQHKKEYDKALASFRVAAEDPRFVLAEHAEYGTIECLAAQGENAAAVDLCGDVVRKVQERHGRTAVGTVALLAERIAVRLLEEAGERVAGK
jgi:hypothetical protein